MRSTGVFLIVIAVGCGPDASKAWPLDTSADLAGSSDTSEAVSDRA